MIEQQKFDGACDDIAQGKFYQAFSALAELYSDGDENDRQAVYALLTDVFYTLNYDAMKENYKNNRELLREYPYWFGPNIPAFEDLGFLVFPCDGNTCFIYYKDDDTFCEVEVNSETETKYFFSSKFKPVFTCDEMNEYNLRFLVDTVRASEDVAMDNHIYLYYENPNLLFALLQVIEIDYILAKKKVVFLIGSENKGVYPIDFKADFGIDYSSMEPQPLRIEELKRITAVITLALSGSIFVCQILNPNVDIITCHGAHFFLNLERRGAYETVAEKMNDVTYTADYRTIVDSIGNELKTFLYDNHDEFFNILRDLTLEMGQMTAAEWFKAISIAKYYTDNGKNYISRYCPMIFWDSHHREFEKSINILNSFAYVKLFSCLRDPVVRFARILNYSSMANVNTPPNNLEHLYEENTSTNYAKWYCAKFEELKKYPQLGLRMLCRFMGVPYDPRMMYPENYPFTTVVQNEFGERLQGFDKKSLNRNIDDVYSELDKLRLTILYAPILERYNYQYTKNIDPLSDDDIKLLFSLPYRFEKSLQINPPGDIKEIHEQLVEVMCRAYFISREKEGIIYPEMLSFDYLE